MDKQKLHQLEQFALRIRIGVVEEIKARGFGHIGGSLSICDALSCLYGDIMRINPKDPKWLDRDKLVCSKGHAGPAIYAALALKEFFPYEDILTLNQPGTNFPSHCDRKKTPGVDMTTGSLGQGTSQAVGLALGDRLKGRDCRTFLFVGDGEANEGQVWEAAMFTAAKKVLNITWIIDDNKRQLDGYTADIMDTFDLAKKFEAFGFEAIKVNGRDIAGIHAALTKAPTDKPIAVILDGIKGAGVPEVEQTEANHSMTVGPDVCDKWLEALKAQLTEEVSA